ncbi:MAG: hypothetical protein ACF8Q5_05845 [Phycisphaerales bacterium JB040]
MIAKLECVLAFAEAASGEPSNPVPNALSTLVLVAIVALVYVAGARLLRWVRRITPRRSD